MEPNSPRRFPGNLQPAVVAWHFWPGNDLPLQRKCGVMNCTSKFTYKSVNLRKLA
jgi:hypothetical protein